MAAGLKNIRSRQKLPPEKTPRGNNSNTDSMTLMNKGLNGIFATLKRWWMGFASGLAWVNTRVLLTIVYSTIFAIGAAVLRLLGKDPLARKFHNGPSYWIERARTDDSLDRSKHQF